MNGNYNYETPPPAHFSNQILNLTFQEEPLNLSIKEQNAPPIITKDSSVQRGVRRQHSEDKPLDLSRSKNSLSFSDWQQKYVPRAEMSPHSEMVVSPRNERAEFMQGLTFSSLESSISTPLSSSSGSIKLHTSNLKSPIVNTNKITKYVDLYWKEDPFVLSLNFFIQKNLLAENINYLEFKRAVDTATPRCVEKEKLTGHQQLRDLFIRERNENPGLRQSEFLKALKIEDPSTRRTLNWSVNKADKEAGRTKLPLEEVARRYLDLWTRNGAQPNPTDFLKSYYLFNVPGYSLERFINKCEELKKISLSNTTHLLRTQTVRERQSTSTTLKERDFAVENSSQQQQNEPFTSFLIDRWPEIIDLTSSPEAIKRI